MSNKLKVRTKYCGYCDSRAGHMESCPDNPKLKVSKCVCGMAKYALGRLCPIHDVPKVSKCTPNKHVSKNGYECVCGAVAVAPTPKKERKIKADEYKKYLLRIQGWAEAFEKDNSSVDIRWLTA